MVQLTHENGETHFASRLLFNKDFKFENEDFLLKRVLKEKK
jgi:hypothetical protein